MKKNDRLELIRKIVQENKITTQGELVKLLQNEGLKATQATVSMKLVLPRYQRKTVLTSMVSQLLLDEWVELLLRLVACCVLIVNMPL